MVDRPACYPGPPAAIVQANRLPLLDVLESPVPAGRFDSPVDGRHVLCLHLGAPVPVSYRRDGREREGVRLHGQFCVVPAGSSTRWIVSRPARSLLLRVAPSVVGELGGGELAPSIHVRDPQIERIGWSMQAEERDEFPSGRLFADHLASALVARLFALQTRTAKRPAGALPAPQLRRVLEYIEAHLDEELALVELAEVAGFSPSHFKHLFKRAVGAPVHRFVLERRVERARTLLVAGRSSVLDVALATGFAHASHLARCMRRLLGVTPSQLVRGSGATSRVARLKGA